jgi:hypothetical protein
MVAKIIKRSTIAQPFLVLNSKSFGLLFTSKDSYAPDLPYLRFSSPFFAIFVRSGKKMIISHSKYYSWI